MGVKEEDPEHCPLVAFMTERKDPEAELTGARGSFRRGGCVPAPSPHLPEWQREMSWAR